ncbi:MAG: patatin-like phospholipase family protein [Patescibacteria group bacterium]|jgi:NTE family protein
MSGTRKTVGLALGGGAMRGLAHVGVIKALLKHGIPIDYLSGTSIGAWVATCFARHQDINELEQKTIGYKKAKLNALFDITLRGGFIRGNKLDKLLKQWFDNVKFEQLQIPTAVVATDLISGQEVQFSSGLVVPAVRASMAIPLVFQPVRYNKQLLVDGGLTNPVPDDVVRAMGADVVIAVNLNSHLKRSNGAVDTVNLKSVAMRSFDIAYHYLTKNTTQHADMVLEPDIDLYWFAGWKRYFTEKNIADLVKTGEVVVDENIAAIKKLTFISQ